MAKHKHVVERTVTRGFSGPVKQPQNRAAHGNVCYIDYCACGAERRKNVNGCHSERGAWVVFDTDEVQS